MALQIHRRPESRKADNIPRRDCARRPNMPDQVIASSRSFDMSPGTIVIDVAGGYVLKDLVNEGDQVIAARGGSGIPGCGNGYLTSG